MTLNPSHHYASLSDRALVEEILAPTSNQEAATYLIYCRYEPLCRAITLRVFDDDLSHLDELQSELFILLKGPHLDWQPLRSFQWRSTFGGWLRLTTYHLALRLRSQLIENGGLNVSLDTPASPDMDYATRLSRLVPQVDDEPEQDRRYCMVLLHEALSYVENPDQRFVVLRRLQGYSSKEVAEQLQRHWEEQGLVHYNHQGQAVRLDSGNIDNLFRRGYQRLTEIYKMLDK